MLNDSGGRSSTRRFFPRATLGAGLLAVATVFGAGACSGSGASSDSCVSTRTFFEQNVWSSFMGSKCARCHTPDGVAVAENNAKLVLQPPSYPGFIDANLATLKEVSKIQYEGKSELLLKPLGQMNHGGSVQLDSSSPEYKALSELVDRLSKDDSCADAPSNALAFVKTLDSTSTLRKASLDLAGRLPKPEEKDAVSKGGDAALDAALDGMMKEDAFADRMTEMFNDVFLTDKYLGYDRAAIDFMDEDVYTGLAPYKMDPRPADTYLVNEALAREPINLINYVITHDRPFTEILTADYTVVNPFLAKAYNVTDAQFTDPMNPKEFVQAHVSNKNGMVPHAGVISTPVFLNRWQTTPTNRNRGRARRLFLYFLATDVLKIAERPVDATKVTAQENPTRDSSACNVCHRVIDPVAGGFRGYDDQDYEQFDPMAGWHDEMFAPGFGSDKMDPSYYTHAQQWLVGQMASDPRFAINAVYMAYKGLTGHEPLAYPRDATDPDFDSKLAAWTAQDTFFRQTAADFTQRNSNFKVVIKAIVKSPYYRAVEGDPATPFMQTDIGTGRLLTPEMLNRKIQAVTGYKWRKPYNWDEQHDWLLEDYDLLYGGIDSADVPTRLTTANSLIASVGSVMANEMSCRLTAYDFTNAKKDRHLFPLIDPTEVPESAGHTVDGAVANIKANIQYLHELLLDEKLDINDPEIERTYQVFLDTWRELNASGDKSLTGPCQGQWDPATGKDLPDAVKITNDPNFTIRSWMAVTAYLLSDWRFLYE
jgi:hypothetical protein